MIAKHKYIAGTILAVFSSYYHRLGGLFRDMLKISKGKSKGMTMLFEKATIIQKPIKDVFELVADLEKAPHVHPIITKTEQLSEGEVGLGTRWRKDYASFGMKGSFELEIVEWQPYQKVVFHGSSLGIVTPHYSIHFQEEAGATQVRYVVAPIINNFLLKFMFSLFAEPYGKRDLSQYFGKLKSILEA
jgi:uncharacterized membrane protein